MFPKFKKAFWLFGLAILVLVIFLPGYTKLQELRDKNRELTYQIKQVVIENSLLQEELKKVTDDPVYQEKIAREKMGVVRKGEVPLKIVTPERKR